MKLNINHNGAIYEAQVTKEKYFYIFRLRRYDGIIDYYEPFSFGRFSCSLQCRLKHYKDFKKRVFNSKLENPFINDSLILAN
ncbi:hypothetical protein EG359_11215 [Chryseobacterium joostei]|uniref:KTSC domain-containing protein n=1 Tax=Chryseobacterium joostei TaxID=112234 RepID=A0A1N7IGS9_9FLAO|nr:hypothetical protein [Chryseobacterium joostei]AZB00158.1 hypothetical protein EG359_11215 [Chryseobacterium joostei]SIS36293.1 hypothetical protein SAMN05421768_105164 [Chryseobacterium joostei]